MCSNAKRFYLIQVRQIDEAKESLKRRERDAARAKSAAKVPTGDMAAQIRAQVSACGACSACNLKCMQASRPACDWLSFSIFPGFNSLVFQHPYCVPSPLYSQSLIPMRV